MRLKKWVVYKFYADPPPHDYVESVGKCMTKAGAERLRKRSGLTMKEWMEQDPFENFYYQVHRLPKRVNFVVRKYRRYWKYRGQF